MRVRHAGQTLVRNTSNHRSWRNGLGKVGFQTHPNWIGRRTEAKRVVQPLPGGLTPPNRLYFPPPKSSASVASCVNDYLCCPLETRLRYLWRFGLSSN
jgi:hypothetical protein